MLKYTLRENPLTAQKDDLVAQITDFNSCTEAEIIDLMVERGTSLTRYDLEAAVKLHYDVVAAQAAKGRGINTSLFNLCLSISGIFNGADDSFDSMRHSVNVKLSAGTLLRAAAAKVKPVKTVVAENLPVITSVTDAVSGKKNSVITPGGILHITGVRLKFNNEDDEQGVFFIGSDNNARCQVVSQNKPAAITVLIPATLSAGIYTLEVRAVPEGITKGPKTIRVGQYKKPLSVNAQ